MDTDREVLARCTLFRALRADESASLIAHARIRKYAAEETIFLIGQTGHSLAVLLSGHVRISVPSLDGNEILLAVLVAGDMFGEIAMLNGNEHTADARAVSECRLAILNRRDVLAFLGQHPTAWLGLIGALCRRLRNADKQMSEIAFRSLPVRLAKALLHMTAIQPQSGQRLCQIRLSQREIGSLIGATRESVNKWLGRWQRMGILRIAESLITILDRAALEELAEPKSVGRCGALFGGRRETAG